MKKAIMASIIALSAIGLVGCDRVEPGNVGIKVNKLGDDKGVGEVVGVGRYWTGWNTEVYIFPTFKQMKTYEDAFNFQMSDGTTIGYHIGVAYKVDPTKVTTVFQTYRKGVDDITDTDLRQKIADALNRLASRMSTDKFIDGGKAELLENALKEISPIWGRLVSGDQPFLRWPSGIPADSDRKHQRQSYGQPEDAAARAGS